MENKQATQKQERSMKICKEDRTPQLSLMP